MVKICSKQGDIVIRSQYPKFKYRFKEAGVALEIEEAHKDKILQNPTFYIETSKTTKKASENGLNKGKGINLNKKEGSK